VTSVVSVRAPGRPRDERATRAIVEAALRQLMALGFTRVSMESVAAEAGVARATVYRRFRDKADLVTAAIAHHAASGVSPQPSGDPRADLERFLVDFDGRFTRSCIEVLGSLLANQEDPCALALHRERVIEPRRAYALSLLERAQQLGELADDADVELALDLLTGEVVARAVRGSEGRPGWARRSLEVIWKGMAPVRS
jgi:AcrR family transcriptional regulator